MKNLKSRKLYFQVYDELRNYIIKQNLRPGDKLPTEMELSASLGVSRNVLREAIKTLEIIGVVSSKPGVGMIVNAFNTEFLSNCIFLNLIGDSINIVEQSQEVRKILEQGYALECFDTISGEEIKELKNIVLAMEQGDNAVDFYELDSQFHMMLYKNTGNHVLAAFVQAAWNCEKDYRTSWVADQAITCEKHRRIVKALENHDFEEYKAAIAFHFTNFKTKKV